MRRLMATCLLAVIVASLIVPAHLMIPIESDMGATHPVDASSKASLPLSSISFSQSINTSQTVLEYPLVSRALMLPGGSTDVTMGDINEDGLDDIIVAVSGEMMISVFYGQIDGSYLSYPSYNITLPRTPIAVDTIDPNANGSRCIAVLEERSDSFDSCHLALYDFVSDYVYIRLIDRTIYDNASTFTVGEFSGDSYPDVAVSCSGPSPSTEDGVIEIRKGPTYTSYVILDGGHGSNSVDAGDFDNDGLLDLALCNFFDSSILIYNQPDTVGFSTGSTPDKILSVDGHPSSICSDLFDGDDADDLIAICGDAPSMQFFFQSLSDFQTTPDITIPLDYASNSLASGDIDSDGSMDVVVVSSVDNVAMVFLQNDSNPIWAASPDIVFPTSSEPRNALIWNISDLVWNGNTDCICSDPTWSGSHLSVYSSDVSNLRKQQRDDLDRYELRCSFACYGRHKRR